MFVFVLGIPDSGKSALSEKIAMELAGKNDKYYIATMIPFGDEGKKRVKKHRALRAGKGFVTVEEPINPAASMKRFGNVSAATCLLECVSNLTGNAMHADMGGVNALDHVISEVKELLEISENLVAVSNSFPSDDPGYDEETIKYVKMMDAVNGKLADMADTVYRFHKGAWIRVENN